MYVGVRAGGGIGDEIEDPAGDPYEMYRIVFDITFFFFVIVILLAIIQGTITYLSRHCSKLINHWKTIFMFEVNLAVLLERCFSEFIKPLILKVIIL